MQLKNLLSRMGLTEPTVKPFHPGVVEEQDRIVEKAAGYDLLEGSSGWADLLEIMLTTVNHEIAEATADSMNPEKQRIHVIRWNAMRELLDNTLSEIKDARKERDRIMEYRREEDQWQNKQQPQ